MSAALAVCSLLPVASAIGETEPMVFPAIRRGDDVLLQSLLRQGSRVNCRLDDDGTTPLMVAALHGSAHAVALLLEYGADATAANRAGVTPLLWAAGDLKKVRLLLEHGADPNARSRIGNTPLIVACRYPDSLGPVKELLAAGADSDAVRAKAGKGGPEGVSGLVRAAAAGNLETIDLLLAAGAKRGRNRALVKAAEIGNAAIVERLLAAGADPNWTAGRSAGHALNVALMSEHHEVAGILMDNGADLTIRTSDGKVPPVLLATYTEQGGSSILKRFVASGAELKLENDRGETAFTWAEKRGHAHLLEILSTAGVSRAKDAGKRVSIPDRNLPFHAGNRQELLRRSASKSLALLQKSSDVFLETRKNCVSCHHQNLPAVAFGWARERGFPLDDASIDLMVERQNTWMSSRVERAYQLDDPVPVPPRLIGYGLLGFAALGQPRDGVSDALTWYLAATQQPDGHWAGLMRRPPMGSGSVLSTVLAMRALQLYPPQGREDRVRKAVQRAREWLLQHEPGTHQERVYRLLGLGWSGVGPEPLASEVDTLLREQRENGGWAQLPGVASDAWATGQTLVALHVAGGLETTHPAYQRALAFLLSTQFDDGSWYVATRSWPFQPYFESQFPHGENQWISAAATAWAAMSMILAVDPFEAAVQPARVAEDGVAEPAKSEAADGNGPVKAVSFSRDVEPIFERSCAGCHGVDTPESGFRVTDREALLAGGESGYPAVLPGKSAESPLIRFVSGKVEDMEMPPLAKRKKYPPLTGEEIKALRQWIDAGAVWPADR